MAGRDSFKGDSQPRARVPPRDQKSELKGCDKRRRKKGKAETNFYSDVGLFSAKYRQSYFLVKSYVKSNNTC